MSRTKHLASIGVALLATACSIVDTVTGTSVPPEMTSLEPVTTTVSSAPLPTPQMPVPAPADLCDSYTDPTSVGVVSLGDVTETSGIAISRRYPETLWMHNDSGGGAFIYATDLTGADLGTYEIDVPSFDWEDMAIGPGPDPAVDYLYLGDIGDNLHFRPAVTVHRIAEPEPNPAGGFIAVAETFNLVYPEPGFDSEAMLVDPVTGDLLLITKGNAGDPAQIYKAAAADLGNGSTVDLELVGVFAVDPGAFVTAADIDPTGAAIVFRGYNEVWLWPRLDLEFTETFVAAPCRTPSTAEVQGEAIAFVPDGFSYVTVSEGRSPDINVVATDS